MNQIIDIHSTTIDDDRIYADISLNGVIQRFECDSGCKLGILNVNDFKKLHLDLPILQTTKIFRTYTGESYKL